MPAGIMAIVGRNGLLADKNNVVSVGAGEQSASSNMTEPDVLGFDGHIMGTSYSVRIAQNDFSSESATHLKPDSHNQKLSKTQLANLSHKVEEQLQTVDALMSTWKYDSEVSRFNRSVSSEWQSLSPDTIQVIDHALKTSQRSMGAFDATVGPLVDLWGFGAQMPNNSLTSTEARKPPSEKINKVLASVGYSGLEINTLQNQVRKLKAETQLDLSGIAKGFAVDQVARLLDSDGIHHYLIEIGGELRAKGSRSSNTPWKVAIEKPLTGQRNPLSVLALNNSAVATSGDYRNYFVQDNERYSHVIDPRYGVPVQHDLVSVTVVSKTTMEADALSTALMIMGPGQALSFSQNNRIAAHFIYRTANGIVEHHSSAFEQCCV